MGIKVWNPELQAFQEAKTPEAYDHVGQVYVPSHGAVYDAGGQAWKDTWSPKLYLYNEGDECVEVTGGWNSRVRYASLSLGGTNGTFEKRPDCMYFYSKHTTSNNLVCTEKLLPLAEIKKYRFLKTVIMMPVCTPKANMTVGFIETTDPISNSPQWSNCFISGGNLGGKRLLEKEISLMNFSSGKQYMVVGIPWCQDAVHEAELYVYKVWLEK